MRKVGACVVIVMSIVLVGLVVLIARCSLGRSVRVLETSPFFYPVRVGTTWIYESNERKQTVRILSNQMESSQATLAIGVTDQQDHMHHNHDILCTKDGIYLLRVRLDINNATHTYDKPLCILRLPPQPNAQWSFSPLENDTVHIMRMGYAEQVTVPAGTFIAYPVTVTIRRGISSPIDSCTEVHWYAAGIGLVKSKSVTGETVLHSICQD
jgi:hypothetical protein